MTMIDLKDKVILVSKRMIDEAGIETFDTYFGKVSTSNENTVIVIKLNGGQESLPYDDDFYELAESGYYELEDGSTFENPDYIAEFKVFKTSLAKQNYENRHK